MVTDFCVISFVLAGLKDTGDKLHLGVVDTGGKPREVQQIANNYKVTISKNDLKFK